MASDSQAGKLAVILHADIAGSTQLVHQDEHLAHERFQQAFNRFGEHISKYNGRVLELRGDALIARFERASDAVSATLSFQIDQAEFIAGLSDDLKPAIRVGIALGEVVIADNTITGAGVVLAQRIEQLSDVGGVCISSAVHEALPKRLPFELESLGEHDLKGFEDSVKIYRVRPKAGVPIPPPQTKNRSKRPGASWLSLGLPIVLVLLVLLAVKFIVYQEDKLVEPAMESRMAFPLRDKPSIAVLPFENISKDADQEYFVDGITEDIITDLSRIGSLRVLARNTTFRYKGQSLDLQEIANDLNVSHILEGSVRKVGNNLRISARLFDASAAQNLWAERYDRKLEGVFKVQDDVTHNIVTSLRIQLSHHDLEVLESPTTTSFAAYDLFLKGQRLLNERTRESNLRAQQDFREAIKLDPSFARAYGALSVALLRSAASGYTQNPKEVKDKALELAQKSTLLDNKSQNTFWALSFVHLYRQEYMEAAREVQKALIVAPNYADGIALKALIQNHLGNAEESIKLINRAILLNPYYSWDYLYNLGWAEYTLGNYEKAVELLQSALERNANARTARLMLTASLVALEEQDDAEWEIEQVLTQFPAMTLSKIIRDMPMANEENMKLYISRLRQAGMPE